MSKNLQLKYHWTSATREPRMGHPGKYSIVRVDLETIQSITIGQPVSFTPAFATPSGKRLRRALGLRGQLADLFFFLFLSLVAKNGLGPFPGLGRNRRASHAAGPTRPVQKGARARRQLPGTPRALAHHAPLDTRPTPSAPGQAAVVRAAEHGRRRHHRLGHHRSGRRLVPRAG